MARFSSFFGGGVLNSSVFYIDNTFLCPSIHGGCKIITNEKTALMRPMLRDSPSDNITREDLSYMGSCYCQQHFHTTALALANSTTIKPEVKMSSLIYLFPLPCAIVF